MHTWSNLTCNKFIGGYANPPYIPIVKTRGFTGVLDKFATITLFVVLMLPATSTGTTIYIPYVVSPLGCVSGPFAPFDVAECHTIDEVPTIDP